MSSTQWPIALPIQIRSMSRLSLKSLPVVFYHHLVHGHLYLILTQRSWLGLSSSLGGHARTLLLTAIGTSCGSSWTATGQATSACETSARLAEFQGKLMQWMPIISGLATAANVLLADLSSRRKESANGKLGTPTPHHAQICLCRAFCKARSLRIRSQR